MFMNKLLEIMDDTGSIEYLNKYLEICTKDDKTEFLEEHHILPVKQFPEYKNKKVNSWNIVKLNPKNHLKAHYYLALGIHGLDDTFRYKPFWQSVNLMFNTRCFNGSITEDEFNNYSLARENAIQSLTYLNKQRDSSVGTEIREKERRKKEIVLEDGLNSWQRAGYRSAETLGPEGCKKRAEKAKETSIKNGSYEVVGNKNSYHAKQIEENGLTLAQNRAYKGHNTRNENPDKQKETKEKQSNAAKNRKKLVCPHCKKEGHPGNMKRWHFDNCKENKDIQ